jgi:ABC-type multidrug transport system ATPase subunit
LFSQLSSLAQNKTVLDLTHVQDNFIDRQGYSRVSGGERKRVSIGIELMRRPSLLFVDEPTSGLSSTQATLIVRLLTTYMRRGGVPFGAGEDERLVPLASTRAARDDDGDDTTRRHATSETAAIVSASHASMPSTPRPISMAVTIHQPSPRAFYLFDYVTLLCGGNVMYFGETPRILDFFSRAGFDAPMTINPADYIIDVLSDVKLEELVSDASDDSGDDDKTRDSSDDGVGSISRRANIYESRRQDDREASTKLRTLTLQRRKALLMTQMEGARVKMAAAFPTNADIDIDDSSDDDDDVDYALQSWWQEFSLLFHRSWLNLIRDKRVVQVCSDLKLYKLCV